MSGVDAMLETLRALSASPEEAARDVAAMLGPRMRTGRAEARGESVAIVPGGRSDAWLGDAWAADVEDEIGRTMAKAGGAA